MELKTYNLIIVKILINYFLSYTIKIHQAGLLLRILILFIILLSKQIKKNIKKVMDE